MVKIGSIIQARLGSERLPNKALLPLPFSGGPALLEHVVMRTKAAANITSVIVATTTASADDAIASFCDKHNILCFRGSEEDVLKRFYESASKYELDVIVRLTGDNPFIMPSIIEKTVSAHVEVKIDYTITEGLPLGTNIEVISFDALKRAAQEASEIADREHVTPYIRREPKFTRQSIQHTSELSDLRLTVDYPSDYALANLLYSKLYTPESIFDNAAIASLLQQNRWLGSVNIQNLQRQVFANEAAEFRSAYTMLKEGGYNRVLQKLQGIL